MRIAVVGLGMGGSTLACLLADRGDDVVVLSPWRRWTLPELL